MPNSKHISHNQARGSPSHQNTLTRTQHFLDMTIRTFQSSLCEHHTVREASRSGDDNCRQHTREFCADSGSISSKVRSTTRIPRCHRRQPRNYGAQVEQHNTHCSYIHLVRQYHLAYKKTTDDLQTNHYRPHHCGRTDLKRSTLPRRALRILFRLRSHCGPASK